MSSLPLIDSVPSNSQSADVEAQGLLAWAHDQYVTVKLVPYTQGASSGYRLDLISTRRDHRSQGRGSLVMQKLVDLADTRQWHLILEPTDAFGSDLPRLIDFYLNYGFTLTSSRMSMRRSPRMKVSGSEQC